jgi:hypothetical protein
MWIVGQVSLHSFPRDFEPKSNETFCGLFCYHRIINDIASQYALVRLIK